VGDVETLVSLAADRGLNAKEVRAFWLTEANREAIGQHDAHARAQGISGVPFLVVRDQFARSGVQVYSVDTNFDGDNLRT
jgi:predicted DsbA family dithiol-disulfide isomerase